jgi:hypothetical protein
MGLTTILTTIWVCPPKSVTVQNPYLQGNRTSVDVLGRAADAWGSRAMSVLSDPAATVMIFPMTDDLVQRQGE